jgi:ABC-2 type transport system ATP-binding protein
LMRALQSVGSARVEVEDIALRQPNLDEVFLTLTGTLAEERPDTAAGAA